MPTINNIKDLEQLLQPKILKAMELTRDEIYEIISRKVSNYYSEPVFSPPDETKPDYYKRTGTLRESLTGGHVTYKNGCYSFIVGFDDDYLEFRYSGGFITRRYGSQYNAITGEQVLQAFNSETHGYTVGGNHNYWDEALEEIESKGNVDGIFKRNLKKVGVPII